MKKQFLRIKEYVEKEEDNCAELYRGSISR